MKNTRIVGVRYVGREAEEQDPVFKSGISWASGQVINFAVDLARQFFSRHPDMFEEAPPDYTANTVLSVPGASNPQPVVSVNLNSMPVEKQRMFARMEFGRTLPAGMPDDEVRREIMSMMLDAEESQQREGSNERLAITYAVTVEEYAALMQGAVELRLVPVRDVVLLPSDDAPVGFEGEQVGEPASRVTDTTETIKTGEGGTNSEAIYSTEDVLKAIAEMDVEGLREFAEKNGIKVHHKAGEAKLREVITAAVTNPAPVEPVAETIKTGEGDQQ